jgi:hypothetical protein
LPMVILLVYVFKAHRYTYSAYMHFQGMPCTRLFYLGLTSAEGQKLECFKLTANAVFAITLQIK